MDARRRAALEDAHLHLLQADLELKRAIAQGLPVDDLVRAAQRCMHTLTADLARMTAEGDGPVAEVIELRPRGGR